MTIALRLRRLSVSGSLLALAVACSTSKEQNQAANQGGSASGTTESTSQGGNAGSEAGGAASGGVTVGGTASSATTQVILMGQAGAAYVGVASTPITITPAFDWNGVIGTGQSLSVGAVPGLSLKQPYNNLMLSLGALGNLGVPPWAPESPELSMVPLVQQMRPRASKYPSPYPNNLSGETPHSAIGNQITAMTRYYANQDFVSVQSAVGESGQGIVALDKPTTQWATTIETTIGRSYDAAMFEVTAITRLARQAEKTYGVGAIVMTHGEADCSNATYKDALIKLQADYNNDIKAITGQTLDIPMFQSQQFAVPNTVGSRPIATQVQWELAVEYPTKFVCTGPKYQYPGSTLKDGIHLSAEGYRLMGEKIGQVYYERIVLGHDWKPLQPETITRSGKVITINFHVPVPPLVWDENLPEPPDFPNGRGFEVRNGSTKLSIDKVEIDGNTVKITCSDTLPTTALTVGYAMSAQSSQLPIASLAFRWGQLKDSDPFVGASSLTIQPNYGVAFELTVE